MMDQDSLLMMKCLMIYYVLYKKYKNKDDILYIMIPLTVADGPYPITLTGMILTV